MGIDQPPSLFTCQHAEHFSVVRRVPTEDVAQTTPLGHWWYQLTISGMVCVAVAMNPRLFRRTSVDDTQSSPWRCHLFLAATRRCLARPSAAAAAASSQYSRQSSRNPAKHHGYFAQLPFQHSPDRSVIPGGTSQETPLVPGALFGTQHHG